MNRKITLTVNRCILNHNLKIFIAKLITAVIFKFYFFQGVRGREREREREREEHKKFNTRIDTI